MANCTIYPDYPQGCTLSQDEPTLTGSLDREDNRRAIAMDIQRRNGIDRSMQRQQASWRASPTTVGAISRPTFSTPIAHCLAVATPVI